MNGFETTLSYIQLQEEITSISKEAFDLTAKVFGKVPINDTFDELQNPSGVVLEDALFCQELLNCK